MGRGDLTDQQWQQLQPLLPPQKPTTGRPAKDHRTIINGILWVLRTGAPWRDLPERYGPWPTVASWFYRWRQDGLWDRLLRLVQQQSNIRGKVNWELHVRAHQHAAGARGKTQKARH
jgi:transposase